ncbi:hypothetical protein BDF14DRAFT_1752900 [Spinellus fusiger]|nr:hypothetical protein BDF14DRAFT_1752900 [Spinellus fusiger]
MDFEDLMDMDWLNTHTEDVPVVKEEPYKDSLKEPLLYTDSFYPLQNTLASDPYATGQDEVVPFSMPTTEQIRHLIELAKRQLALQEEGQTTVPLLYTEPAVQTVAPEDLMKQEGRRDSSSSLSPSVVSDDLALEACAEADGIDIKKLTPKERRQLRNKISARNFRVRRKEYITTLEEQVDTHKKHAERLQDRLGYVEDENKQLRTEVDHLRRQNQLLQQNGSCDLVRTPSPRPSLKPNLHKDLSILGTKARETYRQDNSILVSSAVMPQWDYQSILGGHPLHPPAATDNTTLSQAAGYFISLMLQLANTMTPPHQKHIPACYEDIYDGLIMNALIFNVQTGKETAHKSFWWWDPQCPQA